MGTLFRSENFIPFRPNFSSSPSIIVCLCGAEIEFLTALDFGREEKEIREAIVGESGERKDKTTHRISTTFYFFMSFTNTLFFSMWLSLDPILQQNITYLVKA